MAGIFQEWLREKQRASAQTSDLLSSFVRTRTRAAARRLAEALANRTTYEERTQLLEKYPQFQRLLTAATNDAEILERLARLSWSPEELVKAALPGSHLAKHCIPHGDKVIVVYEKRFFVHKEEMAPYRTHALVLYALKDGAVISRWFGVPAREVSSEKKVKRLADDLLARILLED